jgi:peptidoglycan/xylan/chitin deacetylase (PgdA/CDA1 family)
MQGRLAKSAAAVGVALACLPATVAGSPTAAGRRPVPILMYHVIAPPISGAPFPDLYVPKPEFAAQMLWLHAHGFRAVTLEQVYRYWRGQGPLPARPVVLTFDDGYRSDYLAARPVLRSLHWPGVLNLAVHNEHRSWGLGARQIRGLLAAGWELDSHTINHLDLTGLDAAQLQHEVTGSRQVLRRQFHVPVDFFCYPSGRYDAAVIAAVQAAGYLGATSTRPGLARPSELWTLARVRVNGSDGVAGLAAKLTALAP